MGNQSRSRPDELIGRESELDAVLALLGTDVPLVTLWGPPGVGKTRLALELASRHAGSIVCDLADASTTMELCAKVGTKLDVRAPVADAPAAVELVGEALRKRGLTLVILDNFEQLGAAGAVVIARWLELAPDLQLLVTSRDPLALASETLCEVAPLAIPEPASDATTIAASAAIRLFVARAMAAMPEYRWIPENAAVTASLVRALDGIPLAIELAAAQVGLLGVAGIVSRLERRLELFVDQRRDITARQRTLGAAIGWSWELLAESERRALAQLSVFRGGFDADAAEAVIACGQPALDVLRSLRSRSLVAVKPAADDIPRYRLLESVHVFATAELDRFGDRAATANRHASYYLAKLPELDANEPDRSLSFPANEIENLIGVFDHALRSGAIATAIRVALGAMRVLLTHGPLARLAVMFDRVIEAPGLEEIGVPVLARVRFARAVVRRRLGEIDAALEDYDAAAALAERGASPGLVARLLCDTGSILLVRGERATGRDRLHRAREIAERDGLHALVAEIEGHLACGAWSEGDLDQALARYARALASAQRGRDVPREARIVVDLAGVCRDLDREADLAAYAARARELCAQIDDVRTAAILAMHLGIAAAARTRFDEARVLFQEALAGFCRVGDRLYEANLESNLGYLAQAAGEIGSGAAHFERALAILTHGRLGWREALVRGCLAVTLAARDELAAAEVELERAYVALGSYDDTHVVTSLDLLGGHLDLCRAREARRRGDRARAAELELRASERLDRARALIAGDGLGAVRRRGRGDVRFGIGLLERALAAATQRDGGATGQRDVTALPVHALLVGANGTWFRAPHGEIVDLTRRRSLRLILTALVAAHGQRRGQALSVAEVVAVGWPNERVIRDAGASRVHVAIATLRRMGLQDVLVSTKDGYQIAADREVIGELAQRRSIEHETS